MTWRRVAREWHLGHYRIVPTLTRARPYAIWRGTDEIERHDSLANAQSRVEWLAARDRAEWMKELADAASES